MALVTSESLKCGNFDSTQVRTSEIPGIPTSCSMWRSFCPPRKQLRTWEVLGRDCSRMKRLQRPWLGGGLVWHWPSGGRPSLSCPCQFSYFIDRNLIASMRLNCSPMGGLLLLPDKHTVLGSVWCLLVQIPAIRGVWLSLKNSLISCSLSFTLLRSAVASMALLFLSGWAIIGKCDGILYGLNGCKVRELYSRLATLQPSNSKMWFVECSTRSNLGYQVGQVSCYWVNTWLVHFRYSFSTKKIYPDCWDLQSSWLTWYSLPTV